jgi:hypothetical protein
VRIKRSDGERLVIVYFPLFLAVLGLLPTMVVIFLTCQLVLGGLPGKKPDLWTTLFFALFALGWGALFSCFVKKSIFDFDLVGRQFNWSRRGSYGKKEGVIPLDQIKSAFVEISSSDNGSTYRPVLSTSQGPFPLMNYFTGGS